MPDMINETVAASVAFIFWGEWFNVGKVTSFGLSRYELASNK